MTPIGRTIACALVLLAGTGCSRAPLAREVTPADSTGYPREVSFPDGSVIALDARPVRILPVNASAVDFLASLVEPSRVVALPETVGRYATFLPEGGWQSLPVMHDLETESVLVRDPDLVIAHSWQDQSSIESLRRAGIPVLRLPETHEYDRLREVVLALGELLDVEDVSQALVRDCDARVEALASRSSRSKATMMTYSNYGTGGWTAGSRTTFDVVISLAGYENAAATAGIESHARVEIETLLRIDPDVLIVAESDGDDPTLSLLSSDEIFQGLSAVRLGRIVSLPGRLALADSHRVVDAAESLVAAVEGILGEGSGQDGGR